MDTPDHPLAAMFPALRDVPKGTQVFGMEERGVTLLYNITQALALAGGGGRPARQWRWRGWRPSPTHATPSRSQPRASR